MGKDGDKKGNPAGSSAAREDLKLEHTRLVTEETRLHAKYEEVKVLFKKLEETYSASKESFSVNRYGQLKDMIKSTASPEVIEGIRKAIQMSQGTGSNSGKSGMAALLKKAQEFSSESQQQEELSQQKSSGKASGKGGKMSGFMKKLKNMTGFTDEPIEDEDVMSNSELERDSGRKQRAISRYQTQLGKAATKLEKLQHSYQASKAHAPPKRYQELKDMIKASIAEKMV